MRSTTLTTLTTLLLGCLAGCAATTPASHPKTVMIDLFHGSMAPSLRSAVEGGGFLLEKSDDAITPERLQGVGALWVTASAHQDYLPAEIDAVRSFVQAGGTLICAGQAWSWANDKKDVATYSLNELGKALGFTITGKNIGNPVNKEPSPYLVGVDAVVRNKWWPSLVESDAPGAQVMLRDENLKPMALVIPSGKGRVFVFGHESMPVDNPMIILNILSSRGADAR